MSRPSKGLSGAQVANITKYLKLHYDKESRTWDKGWSDKRVADTCMKLCPGSVSVANVATIRKAMNGNGISVAEFRKMQALVTKLAHAHNNLVKIVARQRSVINYMAVDLRVHDIDGAWQRAAELHKLTPAGAGMGVKREKQLRSVHDERSTASGGRVRSGMGTEHCQGSEETKGVSA